MQPAGKRAKRFCVSLRVRLRTVEVGEQGQKIFAFHVRNRYVGRRLQGKDDCRAGKILRQKEKLDVEGAFCGIEERRFYQPQKISGFVCEGCISKAARVPQKLYAGKILQVIRI